MQKFGKQDKYFLYNTLNCVPYVLQGIGVLIDLRNETSVAGRLENTDGMMNLELTDAVFIDRNGLQYPFEQFMVRERMVRQIHIPNDIDMELALRDWFEQGGLRASRPIVKKKKGKRTYKQKRAEERHKEILQQIKEHKKENNNKKQEES